MFNQSHPETKYWKTPSGRFYQRYSQAIIVTCAVLVLLLIATASVFVGSRDISPQTTVQALFHFDSNNTQHLIVHHLRIPRTLLAMVVGAALGLSGVLIQALTRNPLADPGILGINSGGMVMIVLGIALLNITDIYSYVWLGLIGAAIAGVLVYVLSGSGSNPDPVRVILAGAAISIVLLAITSLVTVNSSHEAFDQFRHWSVGSLQGRGYDVLYPVSAFVFAGIIIAISLTRSLDSIVLGHQQSVALGINPALVWSCAYLAITLLAGAATAAAGPIAFLGLTAPHIAKLLVGNAHSKLIPISILCSAILLLFADVLGRIVGYPGEISAGIMVALLGAPFFLFLVRR